MLAIAGKRAHNRRIAHAVLAAIIGYGAATALAALCGALLPIDGPERALSGMFIGFITWPCVTIAAFGLTRDLPQLLKFAALPTSLLLFVAYLLGWRA
ncbi:hypothetical protein D5366_00890 [Neokomagataea tanensis]|uniref:DUF3649 domain-containing protein n=1 Tax=Neokomagataea tanensis TaxID=661191 RepID=A0A4Y6V6U7_9PROT|nr:hypothetical protein D5366_00890 [Neokomagataea tanensis]